MLAREKLFIKKTLKISIKTPTRSFIDTGKIILKFTWKDKGARIAKIIFEKE